MGTLSTPGLAFGALPGTGFSANRDGTWIFGSNGYPYFYLFDEGINGTAPIISGRGSDRFTIESATALVLRSLTNHMEIEGGSVSPTQAEEIVPYKGGTATGVPLNFRTDATSQAEYVIGIPAQPGQAGSLFQTQDVNGNPM